MNKSIRGNYTAIAEQEMLDLEDNNRRIHISKCYFDFGDNRLNDKNDHPEGICMYCDWNRQMAGLNWDHSNFVEFWDYPPIWYKKYRAENSLIAFEDIVHYYNM